MSDRPSHAQISEAYMKGWLAGDLGAPKHLCPHGSADKASAILRGHWLAGWNDRDMEKANG